MKKLLFYCTISLSFSLLMSSCHKDPVNPFEGRVVAEGFVRQMGIKKGVVPNATVVLYEVKTSGDPFAPVYFTPLDTAITNAEGFYSLDKPVSSGSSIFELGASALNYDEDYFSLGDPTANPLDPNAKGLGRNVKVRHDIGLKPYSWVKVHVKNISPSDDNDSILIGITNVNGADEFYIGANIEETFIRKIMGNDSTQVSYRLQNGFSSFTYKESEKKYVGTHDTISFNINY